MTWIETQQLFIDIELPYQELTNITETFKDPTEQKRRTMKLIRNNIHDDDKDSRNTKLFRSLKRLQRTDLANAFKKACDDNCDFEDAD